MGMVDIASFYFISIHSFFIITKMSVLFEICPVLEKTNTLLYSLSPMQLMGDGGGGLHWGTLAREATWKSTRESAGNPEVLFF